MKAKLAYLLTCLTKLGSAERLRCPSCGSEHSKLTYRKYLVTALRRCDSCKLQFRTPTTSEKENEAFYQEEYSQGFTTDTPGDAELAEMKSNSFKGTGKDYAEYIAVLKALGLKAGDRLFDFGCSWGYGSWQFQEAGFQVEAFEISKPRCRYAREKLDINAHDTLEGLPAGEFDVFFSSHVLEHVPSVADSISLARKLLKPGGLFVAFTPNGSDAFRKANADSWRKLWGMVHPNFLDDIYYRECFDNPLLASSPYDCSRLSETWPDNKEAQEPLNGVELLVASRLGS